MTRTIGVRFGRHEDVFTSAFCRPFSPCEAGCRIAEQIINYSNRVIATRPSRIRILSCIAAAAQRLQTSGRLSGFRYLDNGPLVRLLASRAAPQSRLLAQRIALK